jgi:hypothetical protein
MCFADNTTTVGRSGQTIEITGLDADWEWSVDLASEIANGTIYPRHRRIVRITFYPSAVSDRMIVRDGGLDNAVIFDSGVAQSTGALSMTYISGVGTEVMIDISDCTLTTPADAKVAIVLE